MTLPQGWEQISFEELTPPEAPIIYGILQPGSEIANGVPYIRPTEIRDGIIDVSSVRHTSVAIAEQYSRSSLKASDTILTIVGTIGKVAEVPLELEGGNITQSSCRIRAEERLVGAGYVRKYLVSPGAVDQYADKRLGTAVPRLNIADIRRFTLPLPPAAEQRRIVAKLDTLTARLACARAELDRTTHLCRQLRSEVLSRSFADQGVATPLGNMLTGIEAGKNLRCEERPPRAGERGVVKVSAVTWGRFDPKQSKTLPEDYTPPASAKIRAGDLLISRANTLELVGATALVDEEPDELYLSDKILRLVMPDSDKRWVMWFLRSRAGRREIEQRATGNQLSMRNISQGALRAISVPYPDADFRKAGVKTIEAAFARADRLEAEAARARALLDRLEAAILARAFRGELVPQDPNDEPASVLLDRIRAERAAAPKPKRGRARKAVG